MNHYSNNLKNRFKGYATIAFLVIIVVGVYKLIGSRTSSLSGAIEPRKTINASIPSMFYLKSTESNEFINALNLSVKGNLSEGAELKLGYSDSNIYKAYQLKAGEIDFTYDGDWYADSVFIVFSPLKNTEGKLEFNADFLGTKERY